MVRVLVHGEGMLAKIAKAYIESLESIPATPSVRPSIDTIDEITSALSPQKLLDMKRNFTQTADTEKSIGAKFTKTRENTRRKTRVITFNILND